MAGLKPEGNEVHLKQIKTLPACIQRNRMNPVFPQSVARTQFSEQAPFAVSPSLFNLQSGETVVIEVSVWVMQMGKRNGLKGVSSC